jgi:CreA protein
MRKRLLLSILFLSTWCGFAAAAGAGEVGRFSNDWTGNGMVVEAFADPKVAGVTCHLVRFDRSVIDRLTKGNWFENPSNSAIACERTGPVVVGRIATGGKGEEVFSQGLSLFFKTMAVRRIYDENNHTLVYVAYSRQVKDASAKMALATVPLYGAEVSWNGAKP